MRIVQILTAIAIIGAGIFFGGEYYFMIMTLCLLLAILVKMP